MKLQFLGACESVTGSCFLIECNQRKILIDCGLIQGTSQQEAHNFEDFPFKPQEIDAVVLTHAHLDHSGRIPVLCNNGFHGPIYTHGATIDLCKILLSDAGYLNERDAEIENKKRSRKHQSKIKPLYTYQDGLDCIKQFKPVEYGKAETIENGIGIRLNDAGHILGSATVEVFLKEGASKKKLVFSGDLGNYGAPILRDPQVIDDTDWLFIESTYGDRDHKTWPETWSELSCAFDEASKTKGNILIPAFTVGRVQELLYLFHKNFDEWELSRWNFFLDSPMAIDATKAYAKYWREYDKEGQQLVKEQGSPYLLPNMHLCRRVEDSMRLNQITSGAVIIAGSGMCNGGRIKHHLKHQVWKKNCHIFITGFQAQGTIGRQLVDGANSIKLWGEEIQVAASIHTIGGLSAHADQRGLLKWMSEFQSLKNIGIIHGEKETMHAFKDKIGEQLSIKAMIPKYKQILALT